MMVGNKNSGHIDLRDRRIGKRLAAELRQRFATFAEDWDAPEMDIYDSRETYDADWSSSRSRERDDRSSTSRS